MTTKTDGGSAFPAWELNGQGQQEMTEFGMSLRDWFAGLALQGICASGPSRDWSNALLAQEAFQLADAMLKARENT